MGERQTCLGNKLVFSMKDRAMSTEPQNKQGYKHTRHKGSHPHPGTTSNPRPKPWERQKQISDPTLDWNLEDSWLAILATIQEFSGPLLLNGFKRDREVIAPLIKIGRLGLKLLSGQISLIALPSTSSNEEVVTSLSYFEPFSSNRGALRAREPPESLPRLSCLECQRSSEKKTK